jgi:hypothetical protein
VRRRRASRCSKARPTCRCPPGPAARDAA